MPKAKKRASCWSYSTGERGVNRVRAFKHGERGLFLEWFAVEHPGGKRQRLRLALNTDDRSTAKDKADELALRLRRAPAETAKRKVVTLSELFDIYEREVTPKKSDKCAGHDRRTFALFLRAFGHNRDVLTLTPRDCRQYEDARRAGTLAPPGANPNRRPGSTGIGRDLRLLIAVLNWAADTARMIDRNPLRGVEIPREENPTRAVLNAEQYAAVRDAARRIAPWLECFSVLAWETGHRGKSIRLLRWSDVDLDGKRIHWRGEADKINYDHWTPLTDEAVVALRSWRAQVSAIGEAWLFAAEDDTTKPRPDSTLQYYWRAIAKRAGIPKGQRYGWHACRRGFASELREVPLRDLKDLGGWKDEHTILTCYQRPDEQAQRNALARRSSLPRAVTN